MSQTIHSTQNPKSIAPFLETYYPSYQSLEEIAAGHHSNTHSFTFQNLQYVVRRSSTPENYQKDQIASIIFKNTLHVPEVLRFEKLCDEYYCVQPKIEGVTADKLPIDVYKTLLPQIFDQLTKIHSLNVDDFKGFGSWNSEKVASFESWAEYLDDVHNEDKWEKLAQSSSFNLLLVKKLYTQLKGILPDLDSDRSLLHGDFGRDNLIVQNRKITGIIDWGESKIGDPVYDIAWLDLWNPELEVRSNYQQYINDRHMDVIDFQRRFEASFIEIAISSLEWTAENLGKEDYEWLEKRVSKVLVF